MCTRNMLLYFWHSIMLHPVYFNIKKIKFDGNLFIVILLLRNFIFIHTNFPTAWKNLATSHIPLSCQRRNVCTCACYSPVQFRENWIFCDRLSSTYVPLVGRACTHSLFPGWTQRNTINDCCHMLILYAIFNLVSEGTYDILSMAFVWT